jgi:radical SAM protein with 4Fe4S-binding SPASM domain
MASPVTFHRSTRTYGVHPFNAMKLLAHSERVKRMLAGEPVFPISVELDLSLRCNHQCTWCSFDGWRQANWINFPAARALTLIDELAACGVLSVTLTGGGEPLVHKAAPEVMRRLTANGLEWGLVTNGFHLSHERRDLAGQHATFVRVSLDAGTPETHMRIHGAPYEQLNDILFNMEQLIANGRDRLVVGASFCVFDSNLREITTAAQRLKAIGASYLEVRPVYPTEWRGGRQDDQGISESNIAVAAAEIECARSLYEDGSFRIIGMIDRFEAVKSFRHRDFYDACRITDLSTVISSDGHVYACCVHRGLKPFSGGSVLERPFRDVWLSEERRAMRDGIDIDKCPKCRYVGLNAVIQGACVTDTMHSNFV